MYGPDLKRLRRKELKIRQDHFAAILGMHPTTVSDWERNETKQVPRFAALIATVFRDHPHIKEQAIEDVTAEAADA
jgi:DNA-binding transcriptional regulator YiaG